MDHSLRPHISLPFSGQRLPSLVGPRGRDLGVREKRRRGETIGSIDPAEARGIGREGKGSADVEEVKVEARSRGGAASRVIYLS